MRALGRVAWAWLLLLQLAGASHVVYDYENLEVEKAAVTVPPSIVDPLLRTAYHFQPPKNWINGNGNLHICCLGPHPNLSFFFPANQFRTLYRQKEHTCSVLLFSH